MDPISFDAWTRRRFATAAAGLTAALLGLVQAEEGGARQSKERREDRCRPTGAACRKESKGCQAKFCLNAPFKIEATWSSDFDHNAYLFVPKRNAATGPSHYLNFACNEGNSSCESKYPFACITEDQAGPGDGVTTIRKLLPGQYEYWVQVHGETVAGELTVVLRNKGGRVVRRWTNPANPSTEERGWHVFDINGKQGSSESINDLIGETLPRGAHDPFTFVCAF